MARLSPSYRPRRPQETVLYRVLEAHLGSFIAEVESHDRPLPLFVRRELEGLLRCGRIDLGFVRQVCGCCPFERLVGLPCGGRGICPSCLGRRMLSGAARLVDGVFPDAPVRQYVLSLPPPLRFMLAYRSELCSQVLGIFLAEVFRFLRWRAKLELGLGSVTQAHSGSCTAIHRCGGSLNLNLHYHAAVLDGVYVDGDRAKGGVPRFRALPAPSRQDLDAIARRVYHRTHALLQRHGLDWRQPQELEPEAMVPEPLLFACAEASLRGVGLLGEQAGQPLMPRAARGLDIPADLRDLSGTGGFDLQAARRVPAGDRGGRERLLRYLLHPPLAHDRLHLEADGRVRLRFCRAWRNGTDAMLLSPHNFIARLVPLVPAPGVHQVVFHGVLASGAARRPHVVPPRPPDGEQHALFDRKGTPTAKARGTAKTSTPKLQRLSWARLLHRMAGYQMDLCPKCGKVLGMVAAVLDPAAIALALQLRGLADTPAELERQRGPPGPCAPVQQTLDLVDPPSAAQPP